MDAEVATIRALSPSFSLARPISPQWRDVEEQWNLRRLILTLFYYSPSLASELSRISMGLHSLSWWKDSCAAESLFTPRPRRPPECTRSPFTSMLTSEPSKINQKTGWCKPFVNLMFAGTFWNHLLNQKKKKKVSFSRLAARLNRPEMMTFWRASPRQSTLMCTVSLLFFFSQRESLHLSRTVKPYDPLSECSFVLA